MSDNEHSRESPTQEMDHKKHVGRFKMNVEKLQSSPYLMPEELRVKRLSVRIVLCMCVHACVYVCACIHACVFVCVCVCQYVCVSMCV